MERWKHTTIAALILVVLGASCAPGPPESAIRDGGPELRSSGPTRITASVLANPVAIFAEDAMTVAGGEGGSVLFDLLHGGLTLTDDQGALRPQYAEAVPTLENGLWKLLPDGRMETTWRIREGATWHDGTPLTADDLVFTATVGQDRELPIARELVMDSIAAVAAPDPHTVVVTWSATFIEADELFSHKLVPPVPRHLLERPYLEDTANFKLLPYWAEQFVGLGPYKLQEWVRGSHMTVVANEHYILGRPKVDEVIVRFFTDHNTLMANLLAGAVDLTLGRSLSLDQGLQIRSQWRDGTVPINFTSWVAAYPQFFNPNPPIVADVRFRKALMYATDRQQMVEAFLHGQSEVAHSFIGPRRPEAHELQDSIVRYDYDPGRATRMIEALGYAKGADGILVNPSGERLSLEVRGRVALEIQVKTLLTIADQWKAAGVAVEPVVVPNEVERDYRANYPTFEIVRQPNDLDVYSLLRYHGRQSPLPENRYAGTNRTRYRNPEYDALLDRFATTIQPNERMQVLGQVIHHMTDQLNIMGMFYDAEVVVINNRLQNISPNAKEMSSSTTWNAHEWGVRG